MNDSSKAIEAVFLAFKQQGAELQIHGQKNENPDSGPLKSIPKATFSPFKGRWDERDAEEKKQAELKRRQQEMQEQIDEDFEEGFEIEDGDGGY